MGDFVLFLSGIATGLAVGCYYWKPVNAHCPHSHLVAIYGDEINHTPGFRRLRCRDCRVSLDGPESLAWERRE